MRELLSKKHRRQLQLLETLFENRHWFHIAELAELLDCSERSLKDDLSSLKSSFEDLIFQSSTNGIRIINTDDTDIEMVYHHFFEHSTNFSVLEFVFFNQGRSAEEVCQQFFISSSSLYRIINHINKSLKKRYRFEISLNPLQITGDEIDIRYFFAQYFSEKYYFLDWPFDNLTPAPLSKLLKFVQEQADFPMNFSTFHMLELLLAVNLYRIKDSHFLSLKASSREKEVFDCYVKTQDFQRIAQDFQRSYNLRLNEEVFEQLFASYYQKNFFASEKDFLQAVKKGGYAFQSYASLKKLIQSLADSYQFQLENMDNLVWHLHNTAHLHRQELATEFILFDQKGNTIHNFQEIFPYFVADVEDGLRGYTEELGLNSNESSIQHLAYTLITHSDRLVLNLIQSQPRLKVLVVSNFDQYHAKSIADTLSYYCSNNFELSICEDLEISAQYLEDSPYDIIISNFIFPNIANKRVIYSNNFNTVELISKLNAMMFIPAKDER